jgi:hypothetical protein
LSNFRRLELRDPVREQLLKPLAQNLLNFLIKLLHPGVKVTKVIKFKVIDNLLYLFDLLLKDLSLQLTTTQLLKVVVNLIGLLNDFVHGILKFKHNLLNKSRVLRNPMVIFPDLLQTIP